MRILPILAAVLAAAGAAPSAADSPDVTAGGGIVAFQPFRQQTSIVIGGAEAQASATLVDLNPHIGAWYLLRIEGAGRPADEYHLENPAPRRQSIELLAEYPGGLTIGVAGGEPVRCALWNAQGGGALEVARRQGPTYAPLCEDRLFLRNRAAGYRTGKELVTEFLRDRVWGGEKLINLFKDRMLRDAHLERGGAADGAAGRAETAAGGPRPAQIAPGKDGLRPVPGGLGIDIELAERGKVEFGHWYPARLAPDVRVSIMQADLVDPALLAADAGRLRPLDPVEGAAVVYLAAFPLTRYTLGFEIGTDHPRVGWSERSLPAVRDPDRPGPDGFDTIAPLVATGLVSPAVFQRTAAVFTGGFKRAHGAFRYGRLSQVNQGSHYGWVQSGVVFSSLQPDLATLLVEGDGRVELLTWADADRARLPGLLHARQNGVPVVETDPVSGRAVPGSLVGNWGAGNWSGSADGSLRTVRGGLCLQPGESGDHLIYAYFSSVTPSAMARVFLGYGCRAAMQLDMNALEHTYLALYGTGESEMVVQHLVRGMEEVDKTVKGQPVPRFIGYPDNRDFFIVIRREVEGP